MEKIKTGSEVCWGAKLQWEHKTFDSFVLFIYWFLLLLKKRFKKQQHFKTLAVICDKERETVYRIFLLLNVNHLGVFIIILSIL